MMIPGSNLLGSALKVIARQPFAYKKFISRTTNSIGYDVADRADPVQLTGSVQAVPRELFDKFGLDFQKDYLMFFVERTIIDIERDVSGDQIYFNGKVYQVLSKTNWMPMDGWVSVLAVMVGDQPC